MELLTLEGPEDVAVVHGELEMTAADGLGDDGGDGPTRWIPKDVVGAVVFLNGQALVVNIVKFESAAGALAETGEDDVLSRRTPEYAVALFARKGFYLVDLCNLGSFLLTYCLA